MPNRYYSPFSKLKITKPSPPPTEKRGPRASLPQESAKGRPSSTGNTKSDRGFGMKLVKTYVAGEYQKGNPSGGATRPWIQGAIKNPGALHRQLGVPQGQSIPAAMLANAAKAGGTLGRRARLAQTLKGFHR